MSRFLPGEWTGFHSRLRGGYPHPVLRVYPRRGQLVTVDCKGATPNQSLRDIRAGDGISRSTAWGLPQTSRNSDMRVGNGQVNATAQGAAVANMDHSAGGVALKWNPEDAN